jgi:hypothetical protein
MEQASNFRRNLPVGIIVWFYNALTQFRRADEAGVMSLAVLTALVALMIASVHLDPLAAPFAILAITAAAGAVVRKMWRDADIDALMARTAMRPIPASWSLEPKRSFRSRLGERGGHRSWYCLHCQGSSTSRLGDLDLSRGVHGRAEVMHPIEHRHRRAGAGRVHRWCLGSGNRRR